jgi:septum formation protein
MGCALARQVRSQQRGAAAKSDAVRILSDLSGRTHRVVTGVALVVGPKDKPQVRQFYETTEVTFATLSSALIEAYVETGEPMDKAGAYGNQGMGGALVEGIRGCYWNVVGLPMHRLFFELTELRPVA